MSTPLQNRAIEHPENFPVASFLLPKKHRAAVVAVYQFARHADDLADEGNVSNDERLAALTQEECKIHNLYEGKLNTALSPHCAILPKQCFLDLLSAFKQDVTTTRYPTWAQLHDYCARSANPIGRLMLAIVGVHKIEALRQSDAICTALQLTNFWQDVAIDWQKGRIYLPQELFNYEEMSTYSESKAQALGIAAQHTQALFSQGAPLLRHLSGRFKWEIAFTLAGGLLILKKLKSVNYNVWSARPKLTRLDLPSLTFSALQLIRQHS